MSRQPKEAKDHVEEDGGSAHGGATRDRLLVERVQTGVRMEKRLVKVLKALAELYDMSLGDLLEGIVLHAFEGKAAFGPESMKRIADLMAARKAELWINHDKTQSEKQKHSPQFYD